MIHGNMQKQTKLIYPDISYKIRGCCFDLYKQLGNGHKEVVYQKGLSILLKENGLNVQREVRIPIKVEGQTVGVYTPDMVINNIIFLELKAKPFLLKEDVKQFWRYLKATDFRLGFLINFGKPGKIEIVRRIYDKARK
jgi:GxxExxY protein